ncbi:hypothetical protein ACOMHN_027529 [Nucella lapillus]
MFQFITTMNLLSLVTVLAVLGGVMTSLAPLPKEQMPIAMLSRSGRSCVIDNRVYRHTQVFTLGDERCIKYICDDGNFYFHEEGCDMGNQCRPINRDYDYECRRYRCLAYNVGGGYRKYEVLPVSNQRCKDAFGQCHNPGTFFRYVMKGRLRRRCSCQPGPVSIKYSCIE